MQNLLSRLGRLEERITVKPRRWSVRRFIVQGPHGLTGEALDGFLRGRGHTLDGRALNIVRVIVGAEDGRPVDLPLADLTPRSDG